MNWRWSVGYLVALVVLLAGVNFWWTARVVSDSNHRWCAVLTTLNNAERAGPPPASTYGRQLAEDFTRLARDEGC